MATVNGVKLDDATYKVVKRMAERGIGKGRAPRESVTIAEMCAALVHTGAFRRIAANKWAKEHPAKNGKPARKPKAKAAKKASRKAKPKKSAPRKAPKRARKPAPAKAPEAPAVESAPAAAAGDLLA